MKCQNLLNARTSTMQYWHREGCLRYSDSKWNRCSLTLSQFVKEREWRVDHLSPVLYLTSTLVSCIWKILSPNSNNSAFIVHVLVLLWTTKRERTQGSCILILFTSLVFNHALLLVLWTTTRYLRFFISNETVHEINESVYLSSMSSDYCLALNVQTSK